MSKNFIIGTRGSLLAVTQCTLIKELIEKRTGEKFELKTIKTQGDQITDKPLWQLEGKDFFTKELDAALLNDEVDIVVHSYKDLGSERPEGLKLGAITERVLANDILLIKKSTIEKLAELDTFIVGTSSPRRMENITKALAPYLPNFKKDGKVECKVLRGNVNTRIQKLRDDQYHAIVLATAGLERLAAHSTSRKILDELLQDLNFLILPQRDFPSSASQGALAIEYHRDGPRSDEIKKILKSVHHDPTANEISRERYSFGQYGGGCHLAVGIYVKKVKDHYVQVEKGFNDNGNIDRIFVEAQNLSHLEGKKSFLVLGEMDQLTRQRQLVVDLPGKSNLFVTSKYCFHALTTQEQHNLWAGGTRTAKQLVEKGFWVNGASDFAGHDEIVELQRSALLALIANRDWYVLSHDQSSSPVGTTISCYTRTYTNKIHEKISKSEVIYWGSYDQYINYLHLNPKLKNKLHACGLGKTYESFLENSVEVTPIADMREFKRLTKVIS